MAVSIILATIECDGCGHPFRVEIDPARSPPAGWSVFDVIEDTVRGGNVHDDRRHDDIDLLTWSCSVQHDDDQMLCIDCTRRDFQRAERKR